MLLSNLGVLATAPGGVARLRELILTLAVQGKLVPQDPSDEPASKLLTKIRTEKDRLIAEGKIKRGKPIAGIAEERPFELPRGWCWTHVADICSMVTDGEHVTPQRCADTTAIPLVTAKNVRHEVMDYTVTDFVPFDVAEKCWQRCKPAVGDVLMVSVGATLGRLCVLRDAVDMVLVRSVSVLRPMQLGVIPDFLARHLMSPGTQREIWGEVKQSAQPCLYLAKSAALKIALPPLAEQSRIVTRVEELMRLCDALEAKGRLEAAQHAQLVSTLLGTLLDSPTPTILAENWQRIATHFDLLLDRPQAVDALEQTILQLAVRGLLVPQDPTGEPAAHLLQKIRQEKDCLIAEGKIKRDKPLLPIAEEEQPFELPLGWEWVRMGDVFDGGSGTTPLRARADYFAGGTEMWVKTTDLTNGLVTTCEELVTKAAVAENRLKHFPVGTVCVAMYGGAGTIGKSGVLGVSSTINQSVFALPPTDGIDVGFLHTYVITVRSQWMSFAAGLRKDPNINGQIIKKMVMPLPPLAEQSRIVTRVASLRRLCADLRQRLAASQSTQAHLAEALVSSVGSGLPVS